MSLLRRVIPELRHVFERPSALAPRRRTRTSANSYNDTSNAVAPITAFPSLFDDAFMRDPFALLGGGFGGMGGVGGLGRMRGAPAVDIKETPKSYIVTADLPGLPKDAVSVEVQNDDTLVLSGRYDEVHDEPSRTPTQTQTQSQGGGEGMEKGEVEGGGEASITRSGGEEKGLSGNERGSGDAGFWRAERLQGSFQRAFTFPAKLDAEHIQAELKDGVLRIVVPKEETKSSKVEIR